MNRKAWRKARKSTTKTVGDIVVSDAEDQTAHTEGLSTEPRLAEDTIEYECCICRDDFPFSGGVAHCEEHFTCNSCVVDAYNAAIADIDAFPAQCCSQHGNQPACACLPRVLYIVLKCYQGSRIEVEVEVVFLIIST